ncbi:MAG: UDP-N-acetylmuramate dehydrogenase [Kofleriaceae bacterium]
MLVAHDVPLAPRTTLGVGGPARRLVRVTTIADLEAAVVLAGDTDDRILILGAGSNLVVGDAGWPGLVIEMAIPGVTVDRQPDHADVTAGAGVIWDDFAAQMVEAGFAGVECLGGIPGLVGATPMQNVGAYGQEVADTITCVRAYDRETRAIVELAPAACQFAYRTSVFKGSERWIIVEVAFRFARSAISVTLRYPELVKALGTDRAPLGVVRDTVIALRRGKGMVVDPADPDSRSAGSFFTNPIVDAAQLAALEARLPDVAFPRFPAADGKTKLAAAWLIERAGFAKGTTVGRVGISTKHALALVNRGGATATELVAFARSIQRAVHDQLGIDLEPEPVMV